MPGNVEANLAQHASLARAAARHGVEVVVFPELSLTGYEPEIAAELAFSERDPRLSPLAELASAHGMTMIVGAPVQIGAETHIGAFIVSPDGSVELYTKRHLGAGEETFFTAADRDPLVRVGATTAAIAICADANRPSHPRQAADRGARTYLASVFITPSGMEHKIAKLRTYAVEHAMTVVFANYGAPSGGLPSGGRSAIWSASGELLAQLGETGSGLVFAVEGDTSWRAGTMALPGA